MDRSGWLFRQLTTQSINSIWLHRFAVLTAVATLLLIWMGGLVTSHGVGMAVPDWPTTYGYNMFFFPFSQWVGGVFYEHTPSADRVSRGPAHRDPGDLGLAAPIDWQSAAHRPVLASLRRSG